MKPGYTFCYTSLLVIFVVFIRLSRARYIDELYNAGDVGGRRRHWLAGRRLAVLHWSRTSEASQTVVPPPKKIRKTTTFTSLPQHPTSARRSAEISTRQWMRVVCSRPVTRSTLEGWTPGITGDNNISHLLQRTPCAIASRKVPTPSSRR